MIENKAQIKSILKEYRFDFIVHLAAQSSPPKSWDDPHKTFEINLIGTLNLLDSIQELDLNSRIIFSGSSAEYMDTKSSKIKIPESFQTLPRDPYGVSKLASTNLCISYHEKYKSNVTVIRPFFVIGPKKTGDVTSDLTRLTLRHINNPEIKIITGNQNITRDFIDIDDAIRGIYCVAFNGKPGEIYNICTGNGRNIKELISALESIVNRPLATHITPLKIRKNEVVSVIGDPKKLCDLGWLPKKTYTSSIQAIYDYWRIHDH